MTISSLIDKWLNPILATEIASRRNNTPKAEMQGFCITDAQIDQALSQSSTSAPTSHRVTAELKDALQAHPVWRRLITRYALTDFEIAVMILALAPEIDLRYETIYAYLNNDVTRKWVTRDLALRLFHPTQNGSSLAHASLGSNSRLFQLGVVAPAPSLTEHPAWRAGGLLISPLAAHALQHNTDDAARTQIPSGCKISGTTVSWDTLTVSESCKTRLMNLPGLYQSLYQTESIRAPILVFSGMSGSGREQAAAALASALNVHLVSVDMNAVPVVDNGIPAALSAALLHQILYGSVVFLRGMNRVNNQVLTATLGNVSGPVVIAQDDDTTPNGMEGLRLVSIPFVPPPIAHRATLWETGVRQHGGQLHDETRNVLTERFVLSPGQIERAIESAADAMKVQGDSSLDDHLMEAARSQTRLAIGSLATRVNTVHTWNDLVLPDTTARQVREVSAAITARSIVYEEWGFAKRLPQGQGLKVLFSGSSGTGKTMAASVIAKEAGLDLYSIDLSGIVSKYIGETEKNLDRVFQAAHNANVILFFDEADALFGKRSEVKDAHDRYANIEVAYLLQKMESHPGAVILATNFSRNMDQAFARRMQYVVEFPIPTEEYREQLWRGMFPSQAPVAQDVDFPFLARQFSLAGGDIRNVALDAAFLAAQNGRVVTMQHVVRAMARQVVKQGRTPSPTDFKHYFPLISFEDESHSGI